jgi:hypothetical protein
MIREHARIPATAVINQTIIDDTKKHRVRQSELVNLQLMLIMDQITGVWASNIPVQRHAGVDAQHAKNWVLSTDATGVAYS